MKNLKEFLGKGIDEVKKAHKSISDISFDALDKVEPIKKHVEAVKDIHNSIVEKTYDTIKKVKDEIK